MGKTKRCVYGSCRNDTRFMSNEEKVFFIPFPKPKKNLSKCKEWIARCGRLDTFDINSIKKHSFVCSIHFEGGQGPTDSNPDILDYRDTDEYKIYKQHYDFYEAKERAWLNRDGKIPQSYSQAQMPKVEVSSPFTIKQEPVDIAEELQLNTTLTPDISKISYSILPSYVPTIDIETQSSETPSSSNCIDILNNYSFCKTEQVCDQSIAMELNVTAKLKHNSFPHIANELFKFIPKDWAFAYNEVDRELNLLKFSKIYSSIIISIKIQFDSGTAVENFEIKVLNKIISLEHRAVFRLSNLFTDVKILSFESVTQAISILDSYEICHGVSGDNIKQEFECGLKKNGYYSWHNNSIHSFSCDNLTTSTICQKCQKIKIALKKRIYRKKLVNKNTSSSSDIKKMKKNG